MVEILHILGLCSDSIGHIDLLDLLAMQWNQLQYYFYSLINYFK